MRRAQSVALALLYGRLPAFAILWPISLRDVPCQSRPQKRLARREWVLISYPHFAGRSVAQPGSAFGSGPKGRGFKSLHSDHPKVPHPWWNWQTRKIQVLMLRDVWVRVPPGAPNNRSYAPIVYRLGHKVLILGRAVRLRLGVPTRGFVHAPIVYRLGHKVLILGRAVRLRLGVPSGEVAEPG